MVNKRPVHKTWIDRFFGLSNRIDEERHRRGEPFPECNHDFGEVVPTPFPKMDLSEIFRMNYDIEDRTEDKKENS
jgi:hypothetical protein